MSVKFAVCISLACLAASTVNAEPGCDLKASQGYLDSVRLVDSLRPEKAGQMRVFAADGSEFNAGQAQWMKAQLRRVESLCSTNTASDRAEAMKLLEGVQDLLRSHQRRS